jgi:hypothetical protein
VAVKHDYFSTGCLHGAHGYCASHTGLSGAKIPATCKFCGARCRCSCHDCAMTDAVSDIEVPDELKPLAKIEGFDGTMTAQPVYITLNAPINAIYGTAPIAINGVLARWSGGGLIIDVPDVNGLHPMRHWIPLSMIVEITQQQP